MRRKDREMGWEFGLEVIDKAQYGVLSVVDTEGKPYSIPISIVRDGDKLYFHSANEGTKVDIFSAEPMVRVVFVGNVKVPELYSREELESMLKDEGKVSSLASTVFTTQFESAIVSGRIYKIEDNEERIKALRLICNKYTPDKLEYFNAAIISGLERTTVFSIGILELTAKRKWFDTKGEEMKWGRME